MGRRSHTQAVERFDRMWWENEAGKQWLLLLPQEDMCQATGTPPHLKYESDGGPGVRSIMKLLATSRNPDRDRRTFFQAQVLFWMLRATDGHAKNFSIFVRPGGTYKLAPLYDVLSAYPVIGTGANPLSPFKARMAMAVRSETAHLYPTNSPSMSLKAFSTDYRLRPANWPANHREQASLSLEPTVAIHLKFGIPTSPPSP